MLLKRRLKNPRFLLIVFLILFILVFFGQYLDYEDVDNSASFKKLYKSKTESENQLKPYNLNDLNENYDDNGRNIHIITKTIDTMKRMVHLDLKGSQPKLAYLNDLIPFFKRAGATGVLIEYEDFFPYENDLEAIRNQNHYTKQELNQIFKLLKDNNLSIIPLIQTYGHLEFVLKLKQFSYLREDKKHFQTITPCSNDTYEKIIFRMVDQILESHPDDIESIHIGCDEIYSFNKNPECKSLDFTKNYQAEEWFLLHVNKIVDYIKTKRPYLNVMIWDDMIRKNFIMNGKKTPSKRLVKFAKSVVPMVWDYNAEIEVKRDVWEIYENIFKEIWVASAFKGATQHLELMPNTTKHYQNQLSWLRTIASLKNPMKIKGIALTGWSRFDHMQSVCEILPAALPSLALCLQTIANYDMVENIIFSKAKYLTECSYNGDRSGFVLDPYSIYKNKDLQKQDISYDCSFPGSNIYKWIFKLKILIQLFENKHIKYNHILNDYNMKNNFFNTIVYEKALLFYDDIRTKLKNLETIGEKEFDKFYYSDLYEEISQVYISRYINLIDARVIELKKTQIPESAPNRPFNKISINMV